MTNQEFSDTFTTLLNSYNTQAQFGEQASKREIVLDEYEKSVLLTQAQDILIKSYFDGTLNQQGQGFDDSSRRQMDFSSLIKISELTKYEGGVPFDERGIIYQLPRKVNTLGQAIEGTTDVLFILNEKLVVRREETPAHWHDTYELRSDVEGPYTDEFAATLGTSPEVYSPYNGITDAENDGWTWIDATYKTLKEFVIIPINYKEYDREMSRPYAQPLKKQAWRLFQNQVSGFDVNTELIPKFNITESGESDFVYRIRYVKRPRPIILETLPNDLEIDGENEESSCELNPIIHMDILNKAVELAIATRGGGGPVAQQQK